VDGVCICVDSFPCRTLFVKLRFIKLRLL
jgi:hypothetical protein